MPKRTFQPNNRRRAKKHGFRARMATKNGRAAIDGRALLVLDLPKEARLLKRAEFLCVYEQGTRIEGRFMTVFVLPSRHARHRVGVTATKKAIGKSHDRNRCKRLLRESFRLELESVVQRYDWVLNARRRLLDTKLDKPLAEFKQIVKKLATEVTESTED